MFSVEYDIYKDLKPADTVSNIKKILNDTGAWAGEEYFFYETENIRPFSLRLSLFNINSIGTNGKGTNEENAKASAYGELLERIENQTFISAKDDEFIFAPDESFCDVNDLKSNILNKYLANLPKLSFLANKVVNNTLLHKSNDSSKSLMLPFYSLKDNCVYNMPYKILRFIQTTNGMCAGNTPEEALVQGLSEICERYALLEVINNKNIVLPDIPDCYYEKYKTIKNLIDYYKKNNFILHIKDASLGENLSVVCVVYEDRENNVFYINFGSHPNLPVAIERALTEFMQGSFNIDKKNILNNSVKADVNGKGKENIIENLSMVRSFFSIGSEFYNKFIGINPSYDFSLNSFIDNNIECISNKYLLNFILNNLKHIVNNDIYIRDVNFLGFPAFYIFCPKMSVLQHYDEKRISDELNLVKWIEYNETTQEYGTYSIESLLRALETDSNRRINIWKGSISSVSREYLSMLCAVVLEDKERILKYIDKIINEHLFKDGSLTLFNIMKDYYSMDEKERNVIISDKYNKQDIDYFLEFKKRLSFESIKKIIKTKKFKNVNNVQIEEKMNLLNEFREKLAEKYKGNCPNQMNLSEIFKN